MTAARSVAQVFAAAMLLAGLLGCADQGPSETEAWLDIIDESTSWRVSSVYIVPSGEQVGWGSDWLASEIGPGESRTIGLEPDTYDIRIEGNHPQGTLERLALPFDTGAVVVVRVREQDIVVEY